MIIDHPTSNGLISVSQVGDHHPSRMYSLDADNKLHTIWNDGETKNRQSLDELYIRNGAFYIARKAPMLLERKIMVENKLAFVVTNKWQVNIDTETDFMLAEIIVKQWKKAQSQSS